MFFTLAFIAVAATTQPVVNHEAACDRAYDHQWASSSELCLEAADEWAKKAASSPRDEVSFIELMESLTRAQTAVAMKRAGNPNALSQMQLAVSISEEVCVGQMGDEENAACDAVAIAAVKYFPKVFHFTKEKGAP